MKYQDDEIDALGWFVAIILVLGWLIVAVAFVMAHAGLI